MNEEMNNAIKELIKKVDDLNLKLQSLLQPATEYHITIHDLNIHDPILKELTFSLEKLDIKELSGALNMGNNFGPKVEQQPKQEQKQAKGQTDHEHNGEKSANKNGNDKFSVNPNEIIVKINDTPIAYSID